MISPAAADAWIRDRVFQPLADRVMNRWQRSCYWLSGLSTAVGAGALIVTGAALAIAMPSFPLQVRASLIGLIAVMLAGLCWVAAQSLRVDAALDRLFWAGGLPIRPSQNTAPRVCYLLTIVMNLAPPMHIANDAAVAGVIAWLVGSYFHECLPKPPRRQEAKAPSPSTLALSGAKS